MAPWTFDNGAQSTAPSAITSGQTTIPLQSSAAFAGLAGGGVQQVVMIQDTGVGGAGASAYEYVLCNANNTGTNTLTVASRGYGGTTAKAFAAGAQVTAVITKEVLTGAFVRLDTAVSQTLTGPLVIPPSLGGTPATTSYGSTPVKLAQSSPAGAASVAFSSIPGSYSALMLTGRLTTNQATSQNVGMTCNGDNTGPYEWSSSGVTVATTAQTLASSSNDTKMIITFAGVGGCFFTIWIPDYAQTATAKAAFGAGHRFDGTAADSGSQVLSGAWNPGTQVAITSLTLTPAAGTVSGKVTLWGYP